MRALLVFPVAALLVCAGRAMAAPDAGFAALEQKISKLVASSGLEVGVGGGRGGDGPGALGEQDGEQFRVADWD